MNIFLFIKIINLCDWQNDRLTEWLSDGVTEWLSDWTTEWLSHWMTEWINGWLNDWLKLNDWLNNTYAVQGQDESQKMFLTLVQC